ncbi:hypothetical protein CTAYLR_000848 [Chrysophaeum taylorii]|uniref:DUF1995 domain-containing protein n=1 Tax=Chrysophaeum taylorii TaxID=2483200 RepID=A0AAD7UQZ7_9STRA|nr:hypothetical protein CTAYLR_000848 [Chrysophaeum taylorii]
MDVLLWWLLLVSARALAPQKTQLGPGSFEPSEWATYPRDALLFDEMSATVSSAWEHGMRRACVRLGVRDLAFLHDDDENDERCVLAVAVELAKRWTKGPRCVLTASPAAKTEADDLVGPGCNVGVATLSSQAAVRGRGGLPALLDDDDDDRGPALVVVVAPDSFECRTFVANPVAHIQCVAARLAGSEAFLVLLNPRLALPSPVAAGRNMPPLLLRDFEYVYVAEADALDATVLDDSGIALYHRWPHPSWRLFERRNRHFAFVGTAPHRPSDSQLRAVYRAANGVTHVEGMDF